MIRSMFGFKPDFAAFDCRIGPGMAVRGNIRFRGSLRIDGEVTGDVIADEGVPSTLVVTENARIEGSVRAANLLVNGTIVGPVQADTLLELRPKAQVHGDIHYRAIEIHHGAVLDGSLKHLEEGLPELKLASSKP